MTYAAATDQTIAGRNLHDHLLVPFATGFAVAVQSHGAAPLIEHFTDIDDNDRRIPLTAMLLIGAPQPTEFLLPAVTTFLVEEPSTMHFIAVAAEALGANPEASEQFAARGEREVRILALGPGPTYQSDPDHARFVAGAANALEHAIITEGTLGTGDQRTRTDEILIDLITVADGDVPHVMQERLAAISASTMGRIQDFIVPDTPFRAEAQAYFGELSHNDNAVRLLTAGAVDQLAVDTAAAIDTYAGLDHDARGNAITLNNTLSHGLEDARTLLGTLGAGFNDAHVGDAERHEALIGALNWVGDGAAGLGLAASPLSGGAGALAGLGVNGVTDLVIDRIGDVTAPSDLDDSRAYVEGIGPSTEAALARLVYDNPETRAQLVDVAFDDDAVEPDPSTISFEQFSGLDSVQIITGITGTSVQQSAILDILYNDFRRK